MSPFPPDLHSPDENWVESIGTNSAYVGLYNTRFRDSRSQRFVTKWYLVARTGLDSHTLRQLEDHLFDLEEQGVGAKKALLDDPLVQRARNFAARNRQRLLAPLRTGDWSNWRPPYGIDAKPGEFRRFKTRESQDVDGESLLSVPLSEMRI